MHVFADYDGTITNEDSLDELSRLVAGDRFWREIDEKLESGELTLRDALQQQLAFVRIPLDEADALLRQHLIVDPHFAAFVGECRAREIPMTILSSGIEPLISRALARSGVTGVPIVANQVEDRADGWIVRFRDDVPNGTDKTAVVRAAQAQGRRAVYIGDGRSDFDAALVADLRFAKRGRGLEGYLQAEGVPFVPFDSFAEIGQLLFAPGAVL